MDSALLAQIQPYQPWLVIAGVFVFFLLLRITRKRLRQRIDEIGYRLLGERGLLIWFWVNAPGVILHELSHALAVLLFSPFGFRLTSVALFRIKPVLQRGPGGRIMSAGRPQSLQLGEVQYVRPQGRFMSYVGDGLSGIAPLFGGIAMVVLLYWAATGYNLWDIDLHLRLFRPGWPWWPLIFAPYLILTITSELWPSHQDWHGARWFIGGIVILAAVAVVLLWLAKILVFNNALLAVISSIAVHLDFALLVLLALDLIFVALAEGLAHLLR